MMAIWCNRLIRPLIVFLEVITPTINYSMKKHRKQKEKPNVEVISGIFGERRARLEKDIEENWSYASRVMNQGILFIQRKERR